MIRCTPEDMIRMIQGGIPFEAVSDDYSFQLKIEHYAPYMCGAVHDGNQFRKSLWANCTHTAYERWYEEDPCTREMVLDHPIVISGLDSRFEYDLNRGPDTCIFEDAWGKQLWHKPLSESERAISLNKHKRFYEVVHALVTKLEEIHGMVLVIDMHSYNWKRWDREVPTWNLGTSRIDQERFGALAESWSARLGGISLPNGIAQTSLINDVFHGRGYFLGYITEHFEQTLVLATEISKVYCDELTGIIYPEVVRAVRSAFRELIPLQLQEFQQRFN
ncbi:N-formylglutamate amidohydrolase [Robiginitalea myxolifaciens]|uniref:N-formylglutamate amidohydrolase n=1 Tax=Robiginitalea myxolifaciens TaxID=400055 RepID=A0A1I6GZ62_9FLAO|nr:N-formylglutamate amidohydrolase [Robiginitalea myxolifaciens]SFR47493.1 N-formylglutamate amidohydrolase [Robiginitalea myxolifaciens]